MLIKVLNNYMNLEMDKNLEEGTKECTKCGTTLTKQNICNGHTYICKECWSMITSNRRFLIKIKNVKMTDEIKLFYFKTTNELDIRDQIELMDLNTVNKILKQIINNKSINKINNRNGYNSKKYYLNHRAERLAYQLKYNRKNKDILGEKRKNRTKVKKSLKKLINNYITAL